MLAINFNVSHIFPYLKFCVCLFFYVDGSPLGRESVKVVGVEWGGFFFRWLKVKCLRYIKTFLLENSPYFLRDFVKEEI